MTARFVSLRNLSVAGLILACLPAGAVAQDLYRSRAEMLKAEALNKQANAAIITSLATYGKTQAEVAKIQQEIRQQATQNDLLETETFYKKRAQYEAYRSARRAKAPSPGHYAERASRQVSARLSSYRLAGNLDRLGWPTLLKCAAYDASRRQIDKLLGDRTPQDSGAGSQNCVDTLACLDELKSELRADIRRYKPSDYLAARKFLDAIALEVQKPVDSVAKTLNQVAER